MQRVTCKDRDDLPLFSILLEYWAKVKFTMDRSLENMDLIRLLSNLHSGSVINCGISMNCSMLCCVFLKKTKYRYKFKRKVR